MPPHPTTLIRFAKCVDYDDLQDIKLHSGTSVLAVDATGFSNFLRSAHFIKCCKEFGIRKELRSFTKLSLAVDTDMHLVVSARVFCQEA